MVKLTGPLFSMSASGTIGGTITYARKGGTPYARQHVIPHNPRSAGQTGNRAMWRFLSQNWAGLSQADKDTWQVLADSKSGQPFNAFMSNNQSDWKQFQSPEQSYPRSNSGTIGSHTGLTVTGGVGLVNGDIDLTTLEDNWGMMIFRSASTGFATALSNCVLIIPVDSVAIFPFVDSPVPAGAWFYNFRLFTDEGVLGAEDGELTATVT